MTKSFSPSNQRIYFAYPVAYGNLINIKDGNNFDITSDFNVRTVDITFNNGNNISYKVYEYNADVTLSGYSCIFNI